VSSVRVGDDHDLTPPATANADIDPACLPPNPASSPKPPSLHSLTCVLQAVLLAPFARCLTVQQARGLPLELLALTLLWTGVRWAGQRRRAARVRLPAA